MDQGLRLPLRCAMSPISAPVLILCIFACLLSFSMGDTFERLHGHQLERYFFAFQPALCWTRLASPNHQPWANKGARTCSAAPPKVVASLKSSVEDQEWEKWTARFAGQFVMKSETATLTSRRAAETVGLDKEANGSELHELTVLQLDKGRIVSAQELDAMANAETGSPPEFMANLRGGIVRVSPVKSNVLMTTECICTWTQCHLSAAPTRFLTRCKNDGEQRGWKVVKEKRGAKATKALNQSMERAKTQIAKISCICWGREQWR